VSQQENAPNKPVHLLYLGAALAMFFITSWSIDWIWGYFVTAPSEAVASGIALVATVVAITVLYRNDRVYGFVNEVAAELKKVTWPTSKEVRSATTVVILISIIAAVILFTFDMAWSSLTELIYG
jgi:preprotein translocase SecE subunit